MIKKLTTAVVVIALVLLLVGVCGCTSPANKQIASPAATTNAKTHVGTSKTTVKHTPSGQTVVVIQPVLLPTPITLSIIGPPTIGAGAGGTYTLYINGQLPTAEQATHITWSIPNPPGGLPNPTYNIRPPGSFSIDANGAFRASPGTYTLTATYDGAATSMIITRLPNPVTPTSIPTPMPYYPTPAPPFSPSPPAPYSPTSTPAPPFSPSPTR